MAMIYAIITETDFGAEVRHDVKGTKELERFTDDRIMCIYTKAKAIYKVYPDNTAIILK